MSIDLKTRYLGLDLEHPLILGASPLVDSLDRVKEAEDVGAAAIVMHSLFEEQMNHEASGADLHIHSYEESFSEATSYFPSHFDFAMGSAAYLRQIEKIREAVSVPLIASLNGRSVGGWTDMAKDMESAGAQALELNLYFQPTRSEIGSEELEDEAIDVVEAVCKKVSLPVAVKLSPFFTSLPHFVRRLEGAGAKAVVLFNRFYQPDINVVELENVSRLDLSNSSELLLRLRWLAILHGSFSLQMSCTGGIQTGVDVIKSLMAGADTVQVVSAVLREGPKKITTILKEMKEWMTEHEYNDLHEMRGSMSYRHSPNPEAIERANYIKILQSWAGY